MVFGYSAPVCASAGNAIAIAHVVAQASAIVRNALTVELNPLEVGIVATVASPPP